MARDEIKIVYNKILSVMDNRNYRSVLDLSNLSGVSWRTTKHMLDNLDFNNLIESKVLGSHKKYKLIDFKQRLNYELDNYIKTNNLNTIKNDLDELKKEILKSSDEIDKIMSFKI